ncbi:hypothetical protein CEXT_735531 [Caerostris extrusa]|uniref:LAGLIDADG homing endonuclease n=1 Tax=Caerostris extrusa TaxID=172846 RepID=A0AAV4TFV2_CAEEX|nr:hypothetical protein CEXT_735531 [Caerostris extrusa]
MSLKERKKNKLFVPFEFCYSPSCVINALQPEGEKNRLQIRLLFALLNAFVAVRKYSNKIDDSVKLLSWVFLKDLAFRKKRIYSLIYWVTRQRFLVIDSEKDFQFIFRIQMELAKET